MSKPPIKEADAAEIAVIGGGLPAYLQDDLATLQGAGISQRSDDFALPFLAIAQSNSPQLDRMAQDKYIEGLSVGDIFNTATRQFWSGSEGVLTIPVWFQKAWVEWVLRDEGGGYVATYPIDDPIQKTARHGGKDKRFFLLPNGHQLVDTSYHFVINPETGGALVASMTSTGLQCSRMWQTLMKDTKVPHAGTMVTPPGFARMYRLRTVYKSNDAGKWYTWAVSPEGWTPAGMYSEARSFFLDAQEHGVTLGRPPVVEGDTVSEDAERDTPI